MAKTKTVSCLPKGGIRPPPKEMPIRDKITDLIADMRYPFVKNAKDEEKEGSDSIMTHYVIGALAGGLFGYFVLFRLIGCATGTCPITANPYISVIYGIILGVLIAQMFMAPAKQPANENSNGNAAITYERITAQEAKARIDQDDKVIVLDVRTKEEHDREHIANSVLIPNETIAGTKPKLLPDPEAEILIYCRSGNRSAQAARKLVALGYTNVYDFGGIINWPYEKVAADKI